MQDASQDCNEEWRPAFGFESHYEVSSLGRLRRSAPGTSTHPGRLLNPSPDGDGYLHTVFSPGNGKRVTVSVHRLVARAFHGPCPPGHEVNHRNGIKAINHAHNLEYTTNSGNSRHAVSHGLRQSTCKLMPDDVRAIRTAAKNISQRKLASQYNVSPATISSIIARTRWGWLSD